MPTSGALSQRTMARCLGMPLQSKVQWLIGTMDQLAFPMSVRNEKSSILGTGQRMEDGFLGDGVNPQGIQESITC